MARYVSTAISLFGSNKTPFQKFADNCPRAQVPIVVEGLHLSSVHCSLDEAFKTTLASSTMIIFTVNSRYRHSIGTGGRMLITKICLYSRPFVSDVIL